MITEEKYIGIIEDPRSAFDKEKDWQKVELVSGISPVKWLPKARPTTLTFDLNEITWRKFPQRFQDGSSTCTMQTSAKIGGIANYLEEGQFVNLSASFGYYYRVNKTWGSGEGMTEDDISKILRDKGLTLEELAPSQNLSETEINKYVPKVSHVQTALVFKTANDVKLNPRSIDEIAAAISSGKGVMLWFKATSAEWFSDVPYMSGSTVFNISHSVTGVDYILWNGEKAIVIEDSFGTFPTLEGQRIITESFLMNRCFLAKEFVDIKNDWRNDSGAVLAMPNKPKHVFLRDLSFSPVYTVDQEVRALQEILRYEGFFPTSIDGKSVDITGYYGAITAKAVLDFQKAHQVASLPELETLAGRKVGPKTRDMLNSIYA